MAFRTIAFEDADPRLDWLALIDRLEAGHRLPRAQVQDVFMNRGADVMLSRHAWIDGLGVCVKTAQVFPGNQAKGMGNLNGVLTLFSDETGVLDAVIDFTLVTKWKTAGDSLLAASKLARKDSRAITILGAGNVARSLVSAYSALFPLARFTLWNRTRERAVEVAADAAADITVADDLEAAVRGADVVASGTMSFEPILKGDWLAPGCHVDLIGAYKADMREADDTALARARIFVDSRDTTLHHIGELKDPLARGVIAEADIVADYYDMAAGRYARSSDDEITLFKNGGGAHLDLMTAKYILDTAR